MGRTKGWFTPHEEDEPSLTACCICEDPIPKARSISTSSVLPVGAKNYRRGATACRASRTAKPTCSCDGQDLPRSHGYGQNLHITKTLETPRRPTRWLKNGTIDGAGERYTVTLFIRSRAPRGVMRM